jgi:hypothetical protein
MQNFNNVQIPWRLYQKSITAKYDCLGETRNFQYACMQLSQLAKLKPAHYTGENATAAQCHRCLHSYNY